MGPALAQAQAAAIANVVDIDLLEGLSEYVAQAAAQPWLDTTQPLREIINQVDDECGAHVVGGVCLAHAAHLLALVADELRRRRPPQA